MKQKMVMILIGILGGLTILNFCLFGNEKSKENLPENTETVSENDITGQTETSFTENDSSAMPDVCGIDLNEASICLAEYEMITEISYTKDENLADGVVVEQIPAAGETTENVTVAQLVVNMNPEEFFIKEITTVEIPYICGKTIDEAIMELSNSGLHFSLEPVTEYEFSQEESLLPGTVVSYGIYGESEKGEDLPRAAEYGSQIIVYYFTEENP